MSHDSEGRLPGGWMSGARLVGGNVRRPVGPHTPFVHALLSFLEQQGFDGAPRVVGTRRDDEVLTFVQGHVPVEISPETIDDVVFSDSGIQSAFALIRRYHDLTAGCALAGRDEIVCHGDLSPWNTVYDDRGAKAFIDWDNAKPGARREDVGYAVWRHLRLGFSNAPPLAVQVRQLRIAAAAYGGWTPSELLDHVADAQRVQRAAFEHALAAGDPRITRLVELGAIRHIETAQRWLEIHHANLLE